MNRQVYTACFSVYGEFFYHMNIRTPHWVGYLFQRPEAHRVHHARDSQVLSKNYSDLPLWDMLFGTFENPAQKLDWAGFRCGFPERDEGRLWEMVKWVNVRRPGRPWAKFGLENYHPAKRRCYAAPVLARQASEPIAQPSFFVAQTLVGRPPLTPRPSIQPHAHTDTTQPMSLRLAPPLHALPCPTPVALPFVS